MIDENGLEIPETPEEVTPEVTPEPSGDETLEEVQTRLAEEAEKRQKAESLAQNYKVRAEKAERLAKARPDPAQPQGETSSLNDKERHALYQANVHIDDFDDVVEYAKFKKISVIEALKSDVIKTTLANKSEYRKTAEVSNTGASRKGATKLSGDVLQKNLSDGKIPEAGSVDAEELFWARRGGKRS